MGEILLLILTAGGIPAFRGGRCGKPWLSGTLTVAGYFLVPFSVWSCKNCSYLNKQYAVICEACRGPYASKALSFS
jgi:hypothetical protein